MAAGRRDRLCNVAIARTAIGNDSHSISGNIRLRCGEISIRRNASESLESLLMGMDFNSGDVILMSDEELSARCLERLLD